MDTTAYSFGRDVKRGYDDAVAKMREELQKEGFGVLTEIDVAGTLKKKLGEDFRRYVILGACNPPLAHRALTAEVEVGVLLPCNVVVYEMDDGTSHVAAFDPQAGLALVKNAEIDRVGAEVTERLRRVIAAV